MLSKLVINGGLAVLLISLPTDPISASSSLPEQRKNYRAAKLALQAGQLKPFRTLLDTLKTYPLFPYLLYDYYRERLRTTEETVLLQFMQQHNELPGIQSLRRAWLTQMARTGQWQAFLRHYTPQQDKTLRCYQLLARMHTEQGQDILKDIRALWLHGESLPRQCDPVFEWLYQSDHMNSKLAWRRVRLAMAAYNTGLGRYLGKWLEPETRTLLRTWQQVHRNPRHYLSAKQWQDTPQHREILLHGIRRLLKQQLSEAIRYWHDMQHGYAFSAIERQNMDSEIAIQSGRQQHPDAMNLMGRVPNTVIDDTLLHWRIRLTLQGNGESESQDWVRLQSWTAQTPDIPPLQPRSRYWQGRALERIGNENKALAQYAIVAKARDYYGFLAADRLQQDYQMNNAPLARDARLEKQVRDMPSLHRFQELQAMGEHHRATQEWQNLLKALSGDAVRRVAALAAEWGEHHRSIAALGSIQAWDELALRFPIVYEARIRRYAKRYALDIAWVFALVRAESAFAKDIRSPAGALGLMQIMPTTGATVAKTLGIKHFHTQQLRRAEDNLLIGTTYLNMMLKRYRNNMVLATAAYNAGPSRVDSWLRGTEPCVVPDVWIERIPFEETRKYVRRVLFYASLYDWRLGRPITPLSQRMMMIRGSRHKISRPCAQRPFSPA